MVFLIFHCEVVMEKHILDSLYFRALDLKPNAQCAVSLSFWNKKKKEWRHPDPKDVPEEYVGQVKAVYYEVSGISIAPPGKRLFVLRTAFFEVIATRVTILGYCDIPNERVTLKDCTLIP